MDISIGAIFTTNLFMLSMVVVALTFTIRRVGDALLRRRGWENNYYWVNVLLPALPIFLGATLAAFVRGLPCPEGWDGQGAKVLYGLLCGFLAGDVYRMVKSFMRKQWPGLLLSSGTSVPQSSNGAEGDGTGLP